MATIDPISNSHYFHQMENVDVGTVDAVMSSDSPVPKAPRVAALRRIGKWVNGICISYWGFGASGRNKGSESTGFNCESMQYGTTTAVDKFKGQTL